MPRLRGRGGNIGRWTRNSQLLQNRRLNRSAENNENVSNQDTITRANESQEQRNERLRANTLRQKLARQRVTDTFRTREQQRFKVYRTLARLNMSRISTMNKQCQHCHALKYKGESVGFCCASGKVVLPPLNSPPEPLKALLAGATSQSKLFFRKIRKFNSCFQMTSFETTKIVQNEDGRNFQSTFKIQGQVYHQIGSLLPMPNNDPKFLQIYFMGDEEQQINARCQYNHIEQMEEQEIVGILELFLKNHNQFQLVQLFNTVSSRLLNDNYTIVIKADKVSSGQHAGQYNAPTINEVAVVMADDAFQNNFRMLCNG